MHGPDHALRRPANVGGSWTPERAERHLRSLELFGMRFGLDRMRRMMTVLGAPQRRFRAVHVLGTNGKSSTTKMIAAILERHGLRTGVYTSPHLISYSERLQVGERTVEQATFAAAIGRAAAAAEQVDRTLPGDDHVTQFELLTAAALFQMAECEVDVAVVEAGLGGRYDATSVIDSPLTVLTNVALEHTRWLGPTVGDIAEEKLAVVRRGGTLVLGAGLAPQASAVAERVAAVQEAQIVRVPGDPSGAAAGIERAAGTPGPELGGVGPGARGAFQRRNFALARAASHVALREAGIEISQRAVIEAARAVQVPGRMHVIAGEPRLVLDGAHNPAAIVALAESLPPVLAGRRLGLVMGVLDDKDAAAMLRALLPLCERAWFTAPRSSRALSPAALQSLARQLGFRSVECEPHAAEALLGARRWASEQEPDAGAAVLATGSVYLVGELLEALASSGEASR